MIQDIFKKLKIKTPTTNSKRFSKKYKKASIKEYQYLDAIEFAEKKMISRRTTSKNKKYVNKVINEYDKNKKKLKGQLERGKISEKQYEKQVRKLIYDLRNKISFSKKYPLKSEIDPKTEEVFKMASEIEEKFGGPIGKIIATGMVIPYIVKDCIKSGIEYYKCKMEMLSVPKIDMSDFTKKWREMSDVRRQISNSQKENIIYDKQQREEQRRENLHMNKEKQPINHEEAIKKMRENILNKEEAEKLTEEQEK